MKRPPKAKPPLVKSLDLELDIIWAGEGLCLCATRRFLAGVLKKFASFPSDFMAEGRGDQEQEDRWLDDD